MSIDERIKEIRLLTSEIEKEIAKAKEEAIDGVSEIAAYIKEAEAKLRDKQIKEMAKDLCALNRECDTCPFQLEGIKCIPKHNAERLIAKGYRKASDVSEEIFADLDKAIGELAMKYSDEGFNEYFGVCTEILTNVIYPIKKKYTEVSERREDIENSPAGCLTPSVTDSKGERNEQ